MPHHHELGRDNVWPLSQRCPGRHKAQTAGVVSEPHSIGVGVHRCLPSSVGGTDYGGGLPGLYQMEHKIDGRSQP